jgi:hypothetical protein
MSLYESPDCYKYSSAYEPRSPSPVYSYTSASISSCSFSDKSSGHYSRVAQTNSPPGCWSPGYASIYQATSTAVPDSIWSNVRVKVPVLGLGLFYDSSDEDASSTTSTNSVDTYRLPPPKSPPIPRKRISTFPLREVAKHMKTIGAYSEICNYVFGDNYDDYDYCEVLLMIRVEEEGQKDMDYMDDEE